MKTALSVIVTMVMLFTVLTAGLLLLAIFDVVGGEETQRTIIKFAQASGVLAVTFLILFGLSAYSKK